VVLLEEPPTSKSNTNNVSVLWVIGVSGIPLEESTLHLTTEICSPKQECGSPCRTTNIYLTYTQCLSVVGHWSIRDSLCGIHFTSHYRVTVTGFYQENPAISEYN
jgi:hypothetical protein